MTETACQQGLALLLVIVKAMHVLIKYMQYDGQCFEKEHVLPQLTCTFGPSKYLV